MISAIILNYLNPELTAKAVDKLLVAASNTDIEVEIIVVDNSAPQTADTLMQLLPGHVKIIANDENNGFAAANNQGIKQAKGEVILILNNDCFINKNVLVQGTEQVSADKNIGVWAPKLVGQDGISQRSCAQFPTLWGRICEYLLNRPWENRIAVAANKANQPIEVDTVIGACMFIRRNVMQEVGLFDEDYFFCSEDVDLCYKMKDRGYKVLFDPRYSAIHLNGASQNSSWANNPYLHQSRKRFHEKHFSHLHAFLARAIIDLGLAMRKMKYKLS